jgi:maltooligosyltrehalose trehalohydrolase
MPIGAEVQPGGGTHFRVWAPGHEAVSLAIEGTPPVPLQKEGDGYHSALIEAGPGTLYRFQIGDGLYPDPASRFQPRGPHGPSMVVDPSSFVWSDAGWKGTLPEDRVVYEMHIGTFTPEGTWQAAARQLPELARAGITVLEVMPVADFPGEFGWGYDGVNLYAPTRLYEKPDDFRAFVDEAHRNGLSVILDVVYNHLGPEGNYLTAFAPTYFSQTRDTDWGKAINFDGEQSGPVREFYLHNALYWLREFHLDGLRFDATQDIHDDSDDHILAQIVREARAAHPQRRLFFVAENEPQRSEMARQVERGGMGLDALWNDDFHHSAMVALTGKAEAYYTDYRGRPQEFVSAARRGFLYQGQRYLWQKQRRGRPAFGLPASAFISFIQNHDQVANSATGQRHHALSNPSAYRALAAVLLLGPATPMLFQGQEFGSSSRFYYFADHKPELAQQVEQGRRDFLEQFLSMSDSASREGVPAPHSRETFEACKLDFSEREKNEGHYRLHRDLLRLRREEPAIRRVVRGEARVEGAVLSGEAFVLRYFGEGDDDRLLVVNLGRDLVLAPAPEPLLAPPLGCRWRILWCSEAREYNGSGCVEPETDEGWRLAGRAAALLRPEEEGGER